MGKNKIITGLLLVLVITFFFSFFLSQRIIKKSYPKTEGKLYIKGIKSEVKIYRDEFGIPYIEAQNEEDLLFALGFVHSQDRLFQMDITRRAGMGRLAEIFGSETLEFDIMFRTAGFDKLAKKLYENSSAESKKICQSYVKGINTYIEKNSGNFSIEFDLLNYQPEKWQPYQVYLIARLVAWELNLGWWVDVVYAQLQNKLPQEKLEQLIPGYPENGSTIIPSSQSINEKKILNLSSLDKQNKNASKILDQFKVFYETNIKFRKFLGMNESYSGSNSWVVSSKLSKTGKPILANDPHLMYSLPSKWYIISLNSPTLKVSGVTIPGSPSIVIGKNENIAWGLTNLMLDDCDLFVEKIDSSGLNYFLNNEWKKLNSELDTIKVKDSLEVILNIKSTHRGPLIQQANKFLVQSNYNQAISMKWTGYETSDELLAFYKINKARDYKEFREALRHFNCPAQNFLCADTKGNIFYKAAGKIPIRKYSNFLFPLDGTNSENDWSSFLEFNSLPEILNPDQGFIATNNNPPTKDFINLIGNLWEPSSRAERILELLKSKSQFSIEDFKNFQNDVVSPYAKNISLHIANAFEKTEIKNENLKFIVSSFKQWNGELKKYDFLSAVYSVFIIKLLKNTFEDELDRELYNEFLFVGNIPLRVIYRLLNEPYPDSISFFDDITTPQIETKIQIIRKSLAETIKELETSYGKDLNKWQWGNLHKVKFHHLFSGKSKLIDSFIDVGPFPIGGDQTTLLNTSFKYYDPFENYLGPSMRQIVDLSNIDSSMIIITSGQSGHIGHKNYKDQSLMWLNGEYIDFITTPEKYRNYPNLRLLPE